MPPNPPPAMEKKAKQRFDFRKLTTRKKPEEVPVLTKSVDNQIETDKASADQPIVYDYMNYPANTKKKNAKSSKIQKTVSFKTIVELVTYTDNWKSKVIQGKLRTEEEQRKCSIKRRNF